jgi:hypothetical protein
MTTEEQRQQHTEQSYKLADMLKEAAALSKIMREGLVKARRVIEEKSEKIAELEEQNTELRNQLISFMSGSK